ncbi:putative reverse transcriptase domain-containing protein, partial [Tanacetum coccineum]
MSPRRSVRQCQIHALMDYSSLISDSEVSNDSTCSKPYLETVKLLKSQYDQLLKDFKKSELMVLGEITIGELRKKLEIVQKEKDGIQFNVDKFENASKSLNKIIECQIVDNYKKDLGYNVVPPPYTGIFMPSTPDFEDEPKGNPQIDLQDQGVIDSGCSRHMIGNMFYLTDYEKIDGGYVAFGGNPKGGKITGKGTQSNGITITKASDNAGQARKETEPVKDYILLLLWTIDPPFSQNPKSSQDDRSKPSIDDEKKVDEDPIKDSECNDQEKEDNVNSTNNVNAASTNEVNVVGRKTSIELPFDPNMSALEDYSIFDYSNNDEDDGAEADMNNLDTTIQVSPIPTTRIHKDHPLDQMIGDLQSSIQTRRMSKNLEQHGFVSTIEQRTNHKDLQNCLFACFLSQEEPRKVFRNKKDEKGIVIRNKARLVAQGYTQEEGIDYDEVYSPIARIEAIRLFLAYALFKDFVVYQMDVKSTFLYGRVDKEGLDNGLSKDDIIFGSTKKEPCIAFEKLMHEKFQMSSIGELISQDKYVVEILKKFGFTEVRTPIETQKPLLKDEDEYQVNLKVSHLHAVKRIFRYLKGQTKLGLWYPKDYPFDLVAYTDSDYAGASLDRNFTTEICLQKLLMHNLLPLVKVNAARHNLLLLDLQLEDAEGVDFLPNSTIFEQLTLIGSKTTAWNEFSSTMASAIICLATNQKIKQKWVKKQKPRKPKRKDTQIPQSSGPTKHVADEAIYKELDDSLVRAATTVSSLEAEQDNGDTIAQTRFENVSKHYNDSLLARGNTLRSGEDSLKLNELIELCTNLQTRVLDLEKTKTTQAEEIVSLKRRVKKLEQKKRDEEDLGEDASKQGRRINDIDADEDITMVNVQDDTDNDIFDMDTLTGDEVLENKKLLPK